MWPPRFRSTANRSMNSCSTTWRVFLHRRQHVLLVGERGVGKNTLVTELARRGVIGKIPFLQHKRVLAVDCRYVPADESRHRLTAIVNFLAPQRDLLVSFDGFATLLRQRPWRQQQGDAAGRLFANVLARLIGLLTPREYEELIADDPDFAEFFSSVEVGEPSLEASLKILRHYAQGLERKYRLTFAEDAIRQAVVLSANYILNDQLPAKALGSRTEFVRTSTTNAANAAWCVMA